jgi:NAD(P)H-dependent FMN reductase
MDDPVSKYQNTGDDIMYNLKIIITTTRPGRKGPAIASWLFDVSREYPIFNTEILDLFKINLPFMDEEEHPILRQYKQQHTKDWSMKIDEADAFIILTPEYNQGFTGVFKNAMDYLHHEWKYKPAGIASYGGVSAGTRAAQMMKQVLTALSMTPLYESVNIPFFSQFINTEGRFIPNAELKKSADKMFLSLEKWSKNLKPMRS